MVDSLIEPIIRNINRLAKEHKMNCNGNCDITLFIVGMGIRRLREGELTEEEEIYY